MVTPYPPAVELRAVVEKASSLLADLSPPCRAKRPRPGAWSPVEILGHLVDSASNNHQRFVRAQLSEDLVFVGYEQDAWVRVQEYHAYPWTELITLWKSYNLHLAWVMDRMSAAERMQVRHRHNLHQIAWRLIPEAEPTTLDYFMRDYVGHLLHHLHQILPDHF